MSNNNQTKTNTSSAMTGNILRAADIDMSKFTFEEPEVNKYGGKSCNVKYNGKPFYIQTLVVVFLTVLVSMMIQQVVAQNIHLTSHLEDMNLMKMELL